LRERDRLPNNRICDIQYDEIRREPIRAIRRIYEYFGWSLPHEAERRMRVLVASQAKRQSANHRYDLSQFGASADQVLSAFALYCKRFGLAQPTVCSRSKRSARSPDPMQKMQFADDL
jgi:hypothetical protein